MILDRSFFEQDTNTVSINLIGKLLCFHNFKAIITETESYIGADDPACHGARGMTKRNKVMFGPAGFSYVYFTYGKYYCLNIVTESVNFPSATLIRGIKLMHSPYLYLGGPGKICQCLGINLNYNEIDLTLSQVLYIKDLGYSFPYKSTPRIGISKGLDKMWRYVITDKEKISSVPERPYTP